MIINTPSTYFYQASTLWQWHKYIETKFKLWTQYVHSWYLTLLSMFFKFPCNINSLNFAQYIIIVKLRLTALLHTLLWRLPYFLIMMTLNMVHSHGKKKSYLPYSSWGPFIWIINYYYWSNSTVFQAQISGGQSLNIIDFPF